MQGLQYVTSITATSSGGSISFTSHEGIALKATSVTVTNDGSSGAVYVNVTTTTGATTGDWPVYAGGMSTAVTFEAIPGAHYAGLSYVSSGDAAPAFRVLAIR